MSPRSISIALLLLVGSVAQARAQSVPLQPPVDGPIERHFEPPSTRFGPGHRGIDIAAPPGTPVRGAAEGRVAFAGTVGATTAVTIEHPGGLSTTYSSLSDVFVVAGQEVASAAVVGEVGEAHPGAGSGLHFGVRIEGAYVDPALYLVPLDPASAIRLAPLEHLEAERFWDTLGIDFNGARPYRPCAEDRWDLEEVPPPPNDNIAVAIAGIGSSSGAATIFSNPPELLGYAPGSVFEFSYRGSRGPGFHEPYAAPDTWRDIRNAARDLTLMLRRIGRRYPGRAVDLIAHSQGGIVARTLLELGARDGGIPRIDHLVTFASPHEGAVLAGEAQQMSAALGYPSLAIRGMSRLTRSGLLALPDPRSAAVSQMAPDSELMEELAVDEVLLGTRYLALTIPEDLIVPAVDAQVQRGTNVTVRSEWSLTGHSQIMSSEQARAIAYDFLRDASVPCPGTSEGWGGLFGSAIAGTESLMAEAAGVGAALLPGSSLAALGDAAARAVDGRVLEAIRGLGPNAPLGRRVIFDAVMGALERLLH